MELENRKEFPIQMMIDYLKKLKALREEFSAYYQDSPYAADHEIYEQYRGRISELDELIRMLEGWL